MIETHAQCRLFPTIFNKCFNHLFARDSGSLTVIKSLVYVREQEGIAINFAPEHHAINMPERLLALSKGSNTAINDNFQMRVILLQLIHLFVLQRWDFAVFFRAEAF